MLFYYINLGLRVFFGAIAGILKLPQFFVTAWITGKTTPAYNPDGIELGASLLRYLKSNGSRTTNPDRFANVTITTKDGVKLHAVIDAGQRGKKGRRSIVFVHRLVGTNS